MRLRRLVLTCAASGLIGLIGVVGAAGASPAQDYMLYCMGCHGAHALGRYMRTPGGRNYVLRVPGAANSVLSDAQLTAVLNWLAQQFNSEDLTADVALFSVSEVSAVRHAPLASVLAARREVVRDLAATGTAPPAEY